MYWGFGQWHLVIGVLSLDPTIVKTKLQYFHSGYLYNCRCRACKLQYYDNGGRFCTGYTSTSSTLNYFVIY